MTSRTSGSEPALRARTCVIALAALLILAGAARAQSQFEISSSVTAISVILLIIMSLVLGIGFMVSRLLGIAAFEAWIREEYVNLVFTAVIIVLFTMFSTLIETTADGLANQILIAPGGSGTQMYWSYVPTTGRWVSGPAHCDAPCQFYLARAFLGSTYEIYYSQTMSTAKYYSASKMWESFVAGGEANQIFGILDIGFAVPLYAQRAVLNNSLELVLDVLLKAMLNVKTQEMMLMYMQFLPVPLFAAGIVFRIPWFTRKLGGLLIALSIGTYVFFPLIYTLGWYTADRTTVTVNTTPISSGTVGGLTPTEEPEYGVLFTNYTCAHQESYGCAAYTESSVGLLDVVARTFLVTLLVPILAIFTTIGFIRQFSPMIGGDAEIAGLTRLI